MELTTLGGIVLGTIALVGGFILEGGHLGALFQPSAFIIVFGGTIGATVVGFSMKEVLTIPKLLRVAFFPRQLEPVQTIELIVSLAEDARREGFLFLEKRLIDIDDPFLQKGIQLVIDGTAPETVKSILETELYCIGERHKTGSAIFEAAGGYAPTMGIIGTVMGLIHVLGSISSPEKLAPAIAVAFMATLYGVASANIFWIPLSVKLQNLSQKELCIRELAMEGILSIQAGNNPVLIREQLNALLKNDAQKTSVQDEPV